MGVTDLQAQSGTATADAGADRQQLLYLLHAVPLAQGNSTQQQRMAMLGKSAGPVSAARARPC